MPTAIAAQTANALVIALRLNAARIVDTAKTNHVVVVQSVLAVEIAQRLLAVLIVERFKAKGVSYIGIL